METVTYLDSKITKDCDCSPEIKRCFLLGRKAMTNLLLLQSCPILCDPIDGSPPGSPIPGLLQARVGEKIAIAFSDDKPRQNIKKQRHYFDDKGQSSQSYGFPSGHVHVRVRP